MRSSPSVTMGEAEKGMKLKDEESVTLFIHSPYLLNLCDTVPLYVDVLTEELRIADACGAIGCVIHMGSMKARGKTRSYEEAEDNFVKNVSKAIESTRGLKSKVILETVAGEGSKIGASIDEFIRIWERLKHHKKRIGLCIDTCHVFAAGYDVIEYMDLFETKVGLDLIDVYHVNDSKHPKGARKDRHEQIGQGYIFSGDVLAKFVQRAGNTPMVLETPDDELHESEITMLRNGGGIESSTRQIIIEHLERLQKIYEAKGDSIRANAYGEAMATVTAAETLVVDDPKELKKLKGIGASIALKINEIYRKGTLSKLKELENENIVLMELTSVSGIGPSTAKRLIKDGVKSIDDLRTKRHSDKLNAKQKLGLDYHEDLKRRIDRKSIAKVEKSLKGTGAVIAGSYRRGAAHSGDIDILIKDVPVEDVVEKLNNKFPQLGELASGDHKYMGIHDLSGQPVRIDVVSVPEDSYATALLYFTGSKRLNIKMRGIAKLKHMRLNEWELVNEDTGDVIKTPTEESVFKALDMEYIPPAERE